MKVLFNRNFICLILLLGISFNAVSQHGKLPAYKTESEKALERSASHQNQTIFGKTGFSLPGNIRYPGEYEESQAVVISWADGYDMVTGVPTGNVDTTYEYGYISAQLCDDIQPESEVWIRVNKGSDTVRVLAFMQNRGTGLYNYRFFVTQGDDWWTRDFGPNGIYYGSQDSVAFIDLKYYAGRDYDNKLPVYLANQLGYPNFESTLNGEGGNLMADGFGRIFFSSMLTGENTDAGMHSPAWSKQQTFDTMTYLFNAPQITETKTLLCDGGTGHIDLYLKMIDEQTIMVAKYPKEVVAGDKKLIEDNYQYLTTLKSTYNRPFRIFRIPHPTGDNGLYMDTTCTQVNADARSFVNGLTVNKTFIYPSYSDGFTGNQAQTDSATKLFQQIMPGYKIRPIDSRAISPLGGELHCITMQIPAENPVLFWHPSLDGVQPYTTSFHVLAKITNHSGIQTAVCKWRKKGNTTWNNLNLTDSSGYFTGDIVDGTLTMDDRIEYYLTATTVNGKTAVKPITAPDGFYTIVFRFGTGLENLMVTEKDYLFGAYPNPTTSAITIPFYALNGKSGVEIRISDLNGRELKTIQPAFVQQGLNNLTVDVADLAGGVYFYSYLIDGNYIATRKFIIAK